MVNVVVVVTSERDCSLEVDDHTSPHLTSPQQQQGPRPPTIPDLALFAIFDTLITSSSQDIHANLAVAVELI
jgi:hypothetical protein